MNKSIGLILIAVVFSVSGQLLLKAGANKVGRIEASALKNPLQIVFSFFKSPLIIFGLLLFLISAFLWIIALTRVDLSFAYPLVGTSYVLILLFSRIFLGEDVNILRWFGALLVALGVVLISRG